MTTCRYDRAARPSPQFLARMESLRPDRRVPNAKLSIPGLSSGVRLSANLIKTPQGRGYTVTVPISCSSGAILPGGISMLSSMFRSDLPLASVELHDSAFSDGVTVQL